MLQVCKIALAINILVYIHSCLPACCRYLVYLTNMAMDRLVGGEFDNSNTKFRLMNNGNEDISGLKEDLAQEINKM